MGILLAMVFAAILVQTTLKIEKHVNEKRQNKSDMSSVFIFTPPILPKEAFQEVKRKMPVQKRFDFSVQGARFAVYAWDEKLAWAKARRIVGSNTSELRRIA